MTLNICFLYLVVFLPTASLHTGLPSVHPSSLDFKKWTGKPPAVAPGDTMPWHLISTLVKQRHGGPSRLKGKGYDLGRRPGPTSFVDEALPVTEHPIDEDPSMILTCPESR
jgi:hypothetical protein